MPVPQQASMPVIKATNGKAEKRKKGDEASKKIVRPFEDHEANSTEDEPKPKKAKIEGEHTRLKQLLSGEIPTKREQLLNGVQQKEDKKEVLCEEKVRFWQRFSK